MAPHLKVNQQHKLASSDVMEYRLCLVRNAGEILLTPEALVKRIIYWLKCRGISLRAWEDAWENIDTPTPRKSRKFDK